MGLNSKSSRLNEDGIWFIGIQRWLYFVPTTEPYFFQNTLGQIEEKKGILGSSHPFCGCEYRRGEEIKDSNLRRG